MSRLTYAAMLVFVVIATVPLELFLRTRVYVRLLRFGLTLACTAPVFILWDLFAVSTGQWSFDLRQTLGVVTPGGLPLEEVLFFVVVPLASVMTLEAVRAARSWPVGDERTPGESGRPR